MEPPRNIYIYLAIVVLLISSLYSSINLRDILSSSSQTPNTASTPSTMPQRTPLYFLSIGGPQFLENPSHPAASRLAAVGKEITQTVRPKAIVVFSAHWSASDEVGVEINVAENAGLIYDFYGFPEWYYNVKFPYQGSKEVAEDVARVLEDGGVKVKRVERGMDHGIWVGFLSAFDPKTNPLDVPIVQVSLHGNEDVGMHYRLGQALQGLRDQGILVIGAGLAVHNLPDFRKMMGSNKAMPYASTFDDALEVAATAAPEKREAEMLALMNRSDAREAHPTLEHLIPIYIVAGAAGADAGERLWTFPEGSLNWAQYRFGPVTGHGV